MTEPRCEKRTYRRGCLIQPVATSRCSAPLTTSSTGIKTSPVREFLRFQGTNRERWLRQSRRVLLGTRQPRAQCSKKSCAIVYFCTHSNVQIKIPGCGGKNC